MLDFRLSAEHEELRKTVEAFAHDAVAPVIGDLYEREEFPYDIVREKCARAQSILVVEMNMGQIVRVVKRAVDNPQRVVLANRIDGVFITDADIRNILRIIQGKGV